MTERLYDVYEVVDHNWVVHYTYTSHDEEGSSIISKLNVKSFRVVEGGEGLDFGAAQTKMWEKSNGRELPDLLEE